MRVLLAIVLGFIPSLATAQEPSDTASPTAAQPQRVRLGGTVAAANLMHHAPPVYPPLARQARISGTVRLKAILGKDGSMKQLEVISGHPLLVQAALDAVRQWQYRPTLLNGEPLEVETTIDVIFALGESKPLEDADKLMGYRPNSQIEPVLRADLLRLMDLLKVSDRAIEAGKKAMEPMRPMMFRTIADEAKRQQVVTEYEAKLAELFKGNDFREGVIATYAKYFDDNDAKAVIAFYESPVGRKFNDAMPGFQADMIELGQRLAMGRVPSALKELCQEHPDLGRQLPGCIPPDEPKKSELFPIRPGLTIGTAANL